MHVSFQYVLPLLIVFDIVNWNATPIRKHHSTTIHAPHPSFLFILRSAGVVWRHHLAMLLHPVEAGAASVNVRSLRQWFTHVRTKGRNLLLIGSYWLNWLLSGYGVTVEIYDDLWYLMTWELWSPSIVSGEHQRFMVNLDSLYPWAYPQQGEMICFDKLDITDWSYGDWEIW